MLALGPSLYSLLMCDHVCADGYQCPGGDSVLPADIQIFAMCFPRPLCFLLLCLHLNFGTEIAIAYQERDAMYSQKEPLSAPVSSGSCHFERIHGRRKSLRRHMLSWSNRQCLRLLQHGCSKLQNIFQTNFKSARAHAH